MISKLKYFFNSNYFDKHLPLDYRLNMIFFLESLCISILSATTNTILNKGIYGVIFQWSFIAFCFYVLFSTYDFRMKIQKPLLLFTAFVYIPFLFFQTAGYNGTAALFAILSMLLLTVLFSGNIRYIIITLNILLWIIICFIQFKYPHLVVDHGSEQAKFIDYIVALVLTLISISVVGVYYRNQFEDEADRINQLNSTLETKNEKLADLATKDYMTETYNRRYLMMHLDSVLGKEDEKQLCLLMFDLDDFKQINDDYGHLWGDEILIEVTKVVKSILRQNDFIARYGGEEFVVILHRTPIKNAIEVAERIRKEIANIRIDNDHNVSVSIGLTAYVEGDTGDKIIERADLKLYMAKKKGKNRVEH